MPPTVGECQETRNNVPEKSCPPKVITLALQRNLEEEKNQYDLLNLAPEKNAL